MLVASGSRGWSRLATNFRARASSCALAHAFESRAIVSQSSPAATFQRTSCATVCGALSSPSRLQRQLGAGVVGHLVDAADLELLPLGGHGQPVVALRGRRG